MKKVVFLGKVAGLAWQERYFGKKTIFGKSRKDEKRGKTGFFLFFRGGQKGGVKKRVKYLWRGVLLEWGLCSGRRSLPDSFLVPKSVTPRQGKMSFFYKILQKLGCKKGCFFEDAITGGFQEGPTCRAVFLRSIFTSLCTGSGRNARPSPGGDFTNPCVAPHGEQKKVFFIDKTPLKTAFFYKKEGGKARVFRSGKFPPRGKSRATLQALIGLYKRQKRVFFRKCSKKWFLRGGPKKLENRSRLIEKPPPQVFPAGTLIFEKNAISL